MRADEWIAEAEARLRETGVAEPRLDSQLLAAHALGQDRSWILAHPEADVPDGAADLLERRLLREPLANLLGWREFYGRRFLVEPGVLVPRQETETLVDVALDGMGGKVLDIGTGTGCLAVTIKLERPNWMVAACDVDPTAVRLARRNAERLGATVHVTRSDLFAAFSDVVFGLIVSNPPYIAEGTELVPEVGAHEPARALFAGPDGLNVYRRLALEGRAHLTAWGRMVVELGDGMQQAVQSVFVESGWVTGEVRCDLNGTPRAAVFHPS